MEPRLFVPDDAPNVVTVAQIVSQYLEAKAAEANAGLIRPESLEQAARYLEPFARAFDQPAADCRRGDLKKFLALHPEYRSPHTKQIAVAQVVACFRWATEEGLIAVCPYARPRDLPACEPRCPITREEVHTVLLTAKTHGYKPTARSFRLALWFLLETGCRTCEMRDLLWEHYDDDRGVFELAGKSTHRTGRKRLLILNHRAWRLIRWLRRRAVPGRVFTNSMGKPWDRQLFARRFRRYADLAGVRRDVTAYSCRHGFCIERLQAGAGERQVADLMGHASTRYIAWYGRGTRANVDYLRGTLEKRKE